MSSKPIRLWTNCLLVLIAMFAGNTRGVIRGADALHAVSSYATPEELDEQIAALLKSVESPLASAEAFAEGKERLKRDAGLIVVVAQALAFAQPDPDATPASTRARCRAMVAAANRLAGVESLEDAQLARDELAKANTVSDGEGLDRWEAEASLHDIMEWCGAAMAKLRRGVTGTRFARSAGESAATAMLIAAIGDASAVDADHVEDEADLPKWQEFSQLMREEGAKLRAACAAKDASAAKTALAGLEKSCRTCHEVFHPEEAQ